MKNTFLNKRFKHDSYYGFTTYLVAINALVYLLITFRLGIGGRPLTYYLALTPSLIIKKLYLWQFVTYMFTHAGFWHFFCNMIVLLGFGYRLERAIGSKEFLLYYMFTGIFSGLLTFLLWLLIGTPYYSLVGASGALFALMFLYAMIFPYDRVLMFYFIPMRVPFAVLFVTVLEIVFVLYPGTGRANVANMTHLFGFVAAFLYTSVRMRMNPFKFWWGLITGKRQN